MGVRVNSVVNKLFELLRPLAKSNKYQLVYSQCKEGVTSLFVNKCNYTYYQIVFLQYITFYASIQLDIYMGEVGDIVLKDDVYADSYYYYKSKMKKKNQLEKKPQRHTNNQFNRSSRDSRTTTSNTHIIFNRPKN